MITLQWKIPSKPPWIEDKKKWAHVWNLSNNIYFQAFMIFLPLSLYTWRIMENGPVIFFTNRKKHEYKDYVKNKVKLDNSSELKFSFFKKKSLFCKWQYILNFIIFQPSILLLCSTYTILCITYMYYILHIIIYYIWIHIHSIS